MVTIVIGNVSVAIARLRIVNRKFYTSKKTLLMADTVCQLTCQLRIVNRKFYTSKKTLLMVDTVCQLTCQFVDVLPMFHSRTGNN